MYKLGDNDFYWLSLPDKTGAYIIPENILFEKNIISSKNECKSIFILSLYPYHSSNQLTKIKTSWLNDYLYFYDKDIEKINKLFIPNDKNNVIINDFIPNILSKKKYILKENSHKLIKIIVSQIFKNVILNNKNKIYECIECKKQLNKSGIIRCLECSRLNSRKVKRPSYEQLLNDLTTLNYTQVGKLYNVSDNCIRKWIKYYNVNGI
jgi:DNA-directed RNA polymerase subunit RPC12/RpoP